MEFPLSTSIIRPALMIDFYSIFLQLPETKLMSIETKMILFLLTFLCLYSGINFYLFFRAKSILHFSGLLQGLILILVILLILAPIIVRTLESLHYEQLARLTACVGYVWMAFVFLFFFTTVLFIYSFPSLAPCKFPSKKYKFFLYQA